jgi:hypothetical protein
VTAELKSREQTRTGRGWLARWLPWSICLTSLVLAGLVVVFGARNARSIELFLSDALPATALVVAFALVGALVAGRQPHNPIAWILCTIGLSAGLVSFTHEYAQYALWTAPGSLPGGLLMAWFTGWVWAGGIPLLTTFLLLLFPDGHLPSPRWRPVAWLSALPIVLLCGPIAILSWSQRSPGLVEPGRFDQPAEGLVVPLLSMVGILLPVCGLACVSALILRFRRARGVEQQQLKWFTFAGALAFAAFITADQLGALGVRVPLWVTAILVMCVAAAIPTAVGIAILRYRLYDIDRLINRTLVYGLLTALLGAVYAAVVLVLGQGFGGVGGQPPSWAVAGATLTVAALFQPARRRIQTAVDRRFNRRKYDAAKTVEAFSARLREEIDLDTLLAELLAVVNQTMQPRKASLWLRSPTRATQDHSDGVTHRPT